MYLSFIPSFIKTKVSNYQEIKTHLEKLTFIQFNSVFPLTQKHNTHVQNFTTKSMINFLSKVYNYLHTRTHDPCGNLVVTPNAYATLPYS